jgi:hypothetical protein
MTKYEDCSLKRRLSSIIVASWFGFSGYRKGMECRKFGLEVDYL